MSETLSVAIDNEAADMAAVEAAVIESAAPEFDEVEFAENASEIAEKDSEKESRIEVTSAIGQMACVACVGCPFFDQCVKPQAMAMKQESEEQELSTDAEDGEEAAIIKPVELIPQQSYLEELLAPDEPLDSSGRGQVVRAGYQQPTANISVDDHQEVAVESPEPAAKENNFVQEVAEKTAVVSESPRDEPSIEVVKPASDESPGEITTPLRDEPKVERVEVEPPREEPEPRIEVAAPETPAVKFDEPEVEKNETAFSNDGVDEKPAVVSEPPSGEPPVETVELAIDKPSVKAFEPVSDESPVEIVLSSRSESPEPEIEKTDDIPIVVEKATIDVPEKLSIEEPQVEIVSMEELDFTEIVTIAAEDIVKSEPEVVEKPQPIDYYQNQEAEIKTEEPEIKIPETVDAVISSPKFSEPVEISDEIVDVTKSKVAIDNGIDDITTSETREALLPIINEKTDTPTVENKVIEPSIEIEKTAEGLDEESIELSEDFTLAIEKNDEDTETAEKKQIVKKTEIIDETPADLDDSTIDIQPETEAANNGYGKTILAQLVGAAVVFLAVRQKLDTMKA